LKAAKARHHSSQPISFGERAVFARRRARPVRTNERDFRHDITVAQLAPKIASLEHLIPGRQSTSDEVGF
jgi:hypothetical protein